MAERGWTDMGEVRPPGLSKTSLIMRRSLALNPEPAREFFYEVLDEPGKPRQAQLNRADYLDMGEPQVITVTIEPGDTLNTKEN